MLPRRLPALAGLDGPSEVWSFRLSYSNARRLSERSGTRTVAPHGLSYQVRSWNGVVPAGTERTASAEPFDAEPYALRDTVTLDGLIGVLGARGVVAAHSAKEHLGQRHLIQRYRAQCRPTHLVPPRPRPRLSRRDGPSARRFSLGAVRGRARATYELNVLFLRNRPRRPLCAQRSRYRILPPPTLPGLPREADASRDCERRRSRCACSPKSRTGSLPGHWV